MKKQEYTPVELMLISYEQDIFLTYSLNKVTFDQDEFDPNEYDPYGDNG